MGVQNDVAAAPKARGVVACSRFSIVLSYELGSVTQVHKDGVVTGGSRQRHPLQLNLPLAIAGFDGVIDQHDLVAELCQVVG